MHVDTHKNTRAQVEVRVKKLHPNTKRIHWCEFLKRGGNGNNPPATDGPHLDYYQDWAEAAEFSGWQKDDGTPVAADPSAHPDVVLGVWRPVGMANPVLDFPLVYLDGASFRPEEQVRFEQEFDHTTPRGQEHVRNLAANLHYHEQQQWYYHHEVGPKEASPEPSL